MGVDPELWSLPGEWPGNQRFGESSRATLESKEVECGLSTGLDPDLLRGIGLDACLSCLGEHWSGSGDMYGLSSDPYSLSFRVRKYHSFLSHDWGTPGWKKLCALLLLFNLPPAAVFASLIAIVIGCFKHVGLLPAISWLSLLPYAFGLTVFCSWQRVRSLLRFPHLVFLDRLCISQSDATLKSQGIMSLAGFLDLSDHLLILWSPKYFQRIWCGYELATFLRHPEKQKPVMLLPVAQGVMLALNGSVAVGIQMVTFSVTSELDASDAQILGIGSLLVACLVCLPTSCYIGIGLMKEIAELDSQLASFSIKKAQCFCCSHNHLHPETGKHLPCDRTLIYNMLHRWYGHDGEAEEENFEKFDMLVRTTLKSQIIRSADDAKLPFYSNFYLSLGILCPALVEAAREACTRSSFAEVLNVFLSYWFLVVVLVLVFFWLQAQFCVLGSILMRWMPRLPATLLISPLLIVSFMLAYFVMMLPFYTLGPNFAVLPLVAFGWVLLTFILYGGPRSGYKGFQQFCARRGQHGGGHVLSQAV